MLSEHAVSTPFAINIVMSLLRIFSRGLAVLLLIGLDSILLAQQPPDLTASIELLGTPTSGTNLNGRDRSVWDLQFFDGRIYLGSGNTTTNPGKNIVWSYSPATGAFTNELLVHILHRVLKALDVPTNCPRHRHLTNHSPIRPNRSRTTFAATGDSRPPGSYTTQGIKGTRPQGRKPRDVAFYSRYGDGLLAAALTQPDWNRAIDDLEAQLTDRLQASDSYDTFNQWLKDQERDARKIIYEYLAAL